MITFTTSAIGTMFTPSVIVTVIEYAVSNVVICGLIVKVDPLKDIHYGCNPDTVIVTTAPS